MKKNLCALMLGICGCWLAAAPDSTAAADRQFLHYIVPAAVTNAVVVRPSPRWDRMNLSIGLPLRNREGLTNLLRDIYDPQSPSYHHFLTPAEFTARFGPTESDYEAVAHYAQTHGMVVTARAANRMLVSVQGPVAAIEGAFHVALNEYQRPDKSGTFRAPAAEPSLDLAVPVLSVGGLDNYFIPKPCLKPMTPVQGKPAAAGSGPGGAYFGKDFRAAYLPGVTLTGTGQTVGLFELASGFYPSDITAYENLAGLPTTVPVTAVLLDGYNGGPGGGNDEVSLDIEMAVSLAPGLAGVLVYEGSSVNDILNRMATDDTARQLSASWTYGTDATTEQIFQEFAAQGQTYFNASGDDDAYVGVTAPPTDDPNITIVGGTTLTTTAAGGAWSAETVWNSGGGLGTGGGISTRYAIPTWQQGISMAANQGSTTKRNLPDVAMVANNIYVGYGNGQGGTFVGTSCATPLWAAFTALVNQLALANHEPAMGFLNPAVYAIGKGSNSLSYTTLFHDITAGNNESPSSPRNFVAAAGYDLCTGWGTPTGSNLLTALALPEPLVITPAGGVIISGTVGGPFSPATETFTLTNKAGGPLNWTLVNTSAWFTVSPTTGILTNGGAAATVTVSLAPGAANLPAGGYSTTLWFTNLSDNFVESRQVTLAIVTPPVITSQPTNESLPIGTTANFTVGTAADALINYQWQENGTNLVDGGVISGSATSTLTISGLTPASAGVYSVILSNAAAVVVSSNAVLTIVSSPPVIVQQPAGQTVLPGAAASFSVAAVGNTPFTYHWQLNGTNLADGANFSGVETSVLTVGDATPATAGSYSVLIANSIGSVTSTGAVLSLLPITVPGATLTSLGSFTGGTLGEYPYAPLVLGKDGNLYSTTVLGGANNVGTIFKVTTNGVLTTFSTFNTGNGADPYGGLYLGKDSSFYGTTEIGGTYADGTAFRSSLAGALTGLAVFNGNNGMNPVAGMIQGTDGNFYGTANGGGANGYGTVFRMSTSGTLSTLATFNGSEGSYPSPVLVLGTDGNFYGTTENGGTNGGSGTVFKMSPAGTLTSLYSFTGGNDGAVPVAGLALGADGNFYGTTYEGGADGLGVVFKITPAGVLTTLHAFTGGADGEQPWGGLIQAADGNLYGAAQAGGTYGYGTVFQISPTGQFTAVAQLDGYLGSNPSASLLQPADGNLYGTALFGGTENLGSVFKLTLGGPLQITGQPVDQPGYIGGNALFTVATSGGSPVYYQWQQNGVNLTNGAGFSGVNSATLRVTNITFTDAAVYSVVVSNAFNSLTSQAAVLQVIYSPPDITVPPVSQTVVAGTTTAFSVTATGNQPLTYQWQENGTNLVDGGGISGSATSTLTLTGVTPASAGAYSVVVSNNLLAASSRPATLAVVPAASPGVAAADVYLFAGAGNGAYPYGGVIQGNDGNLYGTTEGGGTYYQGSIFRLGLSGGITTVYSFPYSSTSGEDPYGTLLLGTNGYFYGTTLNGGANSNGVVFKMGSGNAVTLLDSFTGGVDGANPVAGLTPGSDGNFYGSALNGGAYAYGTVFQTTPTGTVTPLYEFTGNDDGANPYAGPIQGRDGGFYGTTIAAGTYGYGTVYRLDSAGTLTTLVEFSGTNGSEPYGGLVQGLDGNLYGTTVAGGSNDDGTVFCVTTNGVLTTLCSFGYTNGAEPVAALMQASDGNFYGTTSVGGVGGEGTVFKITTNGVLTTLLAFDGLNGASPEAALIQATNGSFYGTAIEGGNFYNPSIGGGDGVVFRLTIPIFIKSQFSATQAVACLPYAAGISAQAVVPAGDAVTFAKAGGPAWLVVATNGGLSGTPTNADIGTNAFTVSVTDTNGLSATATLNIVVVADPPPTFASNPLAEPQVYVNQPYSGTIATNATAPYLAAGDVLTFAKVSGPAWLNIAPDGTLSGTPLEINAGTNTFQASVTDLGGGSNTTTVVIYVNNSPVFLVSNFVEPAATVGLPYTGTVATNLADPGLGSGDTLTFAKAGGPAWLNVAANGALSGQPAAADLGANFFSLTAVDSDGLSANGTLEITVTTNSPPAFLSNPLTGPAASIGKPYFATIAADATDPNFGDLLTFAKVSGPAWLTVASNGGLSGTPVTGGTNSFLVSVTDFGGLSATASLNITVLASLVLTISDQGGNVIIGWSGGVPPYQVQVTPNFGTTPWQNLGAPTTATNLIISPTNIESLYRILGH